MKESCKQHTKGDGSWWENDARGIPLCRVCEDCEKEKLSHYKPEVLDGDGYDEAVDYEEVYGDEGED